MVGVFSLEMSREALLMRMLCSQAQSRLPQAAARVPVPGRHAKAARAMEQLMQAPIFHRRHAGHFRQRDARQGAAAEASRGRLDLIIVDYLQLMSGGRQAL